MIHDTVMIYLHLHDCFRCFVKYVNILLTISHVGWLLRLHECISDKGLVVFITDETIKSNLVDIMNKWFVLILLHITI